MLEPLEQNEHSNLHGPHDSLPLARDETPRALARVRTKGPLNVDLKARWFLDPNLEDRHGAIRTDRLLGSLPTEQKYRQPTEIAETEPRHRLQPVDGK